MIEGKHYIQILHLANEDLNKLNSTKNKLVSIIAHDLRSPFSIIVGFSKVLLNKVNIWDEQKRISYIDLIVDSAQNVYHLLNNLLIWARIQQEGI
jgi:K+-sensing histidine kinase KdpD